MAEVLVFHHALGLTPGVAGFADELRGAGHTVHAPDLYDGKTFDDIESGVAHAREIGFGKVIELGRSIADHLHPGIVYAGFSLGVMPAQMLTQNRPGAKGALFFHSSVPMSEFGGTWPEGVPLQIHTMQDDDWGDVDIARQLDASIETAELFLYPGDGHLFVDPTGPDYDEESAALLKERVLTFLAGID